MNDAAVPFDDAVSRIAAECARLGYDLGWRFLYSPKATLGPSTDIAFFGINPGGKVFEPPVASVEQGNAYRTECWPGNGASLQREVKKLFQLLAGALVASRPRSPVERPAGAPCRGAAPGRSCWPRRVPKS
ncbi:MAG: hypothetical protein A3K19_23565 [Lentisphaerae bacterium RIFOXYB12_FULL_65_16]|nr:MAG: hypothetical protein A3K18_29240 [Lentisphaerae bacterium RIFOXYA12_64_32]OGV94077.1 MAG: hypothetical protein A3K19_23565 [Lentisphaerae bacterium RIFOXYB12_FULL_65_16]